MYIKMNKVSEDNTHVRYQFETGVQGEQYLKNGKIRYNIITKYGYCTFNKQTSELELDTEKTDSYFLEKNNREKWAMWARLSLLNKQRGEFTDIIDIATG